MAVAVAVTVTVTVTRRMMSSGPTIFVSGTFSTRTSFDP